MISREEMQAIWAGVQRNHAVLDACPGPHDFQDISPEKKIGKKYRCSKCRGELDGINVRWYERGLDHARKAATP